MSATAITFIEAPQSYRITVGQNAAPSTSTASYTLTRKDGSPCEAHPSLVWVAASNPSVAELALVEPLLEGVIYTLAVSGAGAADVAFRAAVLPSSPTPGEGGDPSAAAFGVDVPWLVDTLGPGRRLSRRTGMACLKHDLATVAVIAPGELFHLPEAGVGLPARLNAPGNDTELKRLQGDLRRQWSKDRRVKRGSIQAEASADGTGLVTLSGSVESAATGESTTIRSAGA